MNEEELELPSSLESAVTKIEELSDAILVEESGKMGVLITLLDQLKNDGHRSLVFSQSRKILDIIQKVLRKRVSATNLHCKVVCSPMSMGGVYVHIHVHVYKCVHAFTCYCASM